MTMAKEWCCEEAGNVMTKDLLSSLGPNPPTLIGFSFGFIAGHPDGGNFPAFCNAATTVPLSDQEYISQ